MILIFYKENLTQAMSIKYDPVICKLLYKVPVDMRDSFSDEQLLALKVAVSGRNWGVHSVDLRWTLKFGTWHYYFVFLSGRNFRQLTSRERRTMRFSSVCVLFLFLTFSMLLGLFLLYLLKSALLIDLIPGFSFGIWTWFQGNYFP